MKVSLKLWSVALPIATWALFSTGIHSASADACAAGSSVGVDISKWDDSAFGWRGQGIVQTFFAEDTLITSLTFWRSVYEDSAYFSLHFFISETDSAGTPRPDRLLLAWPYEIRQDGDGVSPTEYRIVFDPPIALARRDTFAMYFVSHPCDGWFNLYDAHFDEYPGGSLWVTRRPFGMYPCGLRPDRPTRYSDADLCFKLEFCDVPTPVRKASWGQVKLRYR